MVELPDAAAERAAVEMLLERRVRCHRLRTYYAGEPDRFGLPIGYAGCSRAELLGVLPLLCDAVSR